MTNNPLKIVLFGPESTGKTALAQALAAHFDTTWIPEFARQYLENKQLYYQSLGITSNEICLEEDILPIVKGQIESEIVALSIADKVLFFDTNPVQTRVYVQHYYARYYDWLDIMIENRTYDYYLLTNLDVAWQADPLRDRPDKRQLMFELFKNELIANNLPFSEVTGTGNTRINNAIAIVNLLLNAG